MHIQLFEAKLSFSLFYCEHQFDSSRLTLLHAGYGINQLPSWNRACICYRECICRFLISLNKRSIYGQNKI